MSSIIRKSIEEQVWRFDEGIRGAKSEVVALQLLIDKKRWLCRNDLYYLACLTGHKEIEKWGNFYRPFCDEVSLLNWRVIDLGIGKRWVNEENPTDFVLPIEKVTDDWKKDLAFYRRLYLCYRAFYKTTIVTKLSSLQLLLNFPNLHLVLAHNKEVNASDNLMSIKNCFLMTPVGRFFQECLPKGKEWGNLTGFSVANRTDYGKVSEENIEAIGVDTEVVGRHWNLAKKNDIVTDKSVNTEDQIVKTENWDELFDMGMFSDTQMPLQDYEGTRYHYHDRYSKLRDNPKIKVIEIPIVKDLEKFIAGDDKEIIHPERFSREGINDLLERDRWVFNCQMMLRPDDPAKKRFTPQMISEYDVLPSNLRCYLLVDPANERKKKSDYTAMTVVGVSDTQNYYIVSMLRDKIGPDERIDKAVKFIKDYNIQDVGWESIGLNNDTFYLKERMWKDNLHFSLIEIKAHAQEKNDRIRDTLVPQYAKNRWFWPKKRKMMYFSEYEKKNVDMREELEREFFQFPNGLHEDLLDTQSFLFRMTIVPARKEEKSGPEGMTFKELIELKENRLKRDRLNPWGRFTTVSRT